MLNPLVAEEQRTHVTMTGAIAQGVMDAKQHCPALDPRIAGEQSAAKSQVTMEMEQAPQRQQTCFRRCQTMKPIMKANRDFTAQMAMGNIEPYMVETVRKNGMLTTVFVDRNRKPRCKPPHVQAVRIGRIRRHRIYHKRSWIQFGMPDNPGCGRSTDRILGESAAPTDAHLALRRQ